MNFFEHKQPFILENGQTLPSLTISYFTYGKLNATKTNVVWVCHALTANANVTDWWKGLVGEGCIINPEKYFIICANILGSCYGSTGPLSIDLTTNQPYYSSFPSITIRDMVNANILLRQHLGIDKIYLLMGGSMGGYQTLEWCMMEKSVIENLFLIATSPSESAWGVAVHTAQRLAIEADNSWLEHKPNAGSKGLKAARAIGMLTYRNYKILHETQTDPDAEKIDNFKASSYINYQGDKLVKRFNAYSYWLLTKAMDSHHLARGRNISLQQALQNVPQNTLVIGITSDILCPLDEQKFIAENMPHAKLVVINSEYGHDGFIIETKQISKHLKEWIELIHEFANS
ncbi:MAG: homoserine O-acetyltransferase [Bacteroidetes bacterium]|nr:homoserine O-acetyltransferase [Bacteroidota bacterium]MBS1672266.1 homoserine O-acetyltransferase [Bacteroidota bacterium]